MTDNGELQDFVDNFPRVLWNILGRKYEVGIDVLSGEKCKNIPVIFVVSGDNPYVCELTAIFSKYMADFHASKEKTAKYLAAQIVQRDVFFEKSKE